MAAAEGLIGRRKRCERKLCQDEVRRYYFEQISGPEPVRIPFGRIRQE